ncbi:hypothetical protein P43SY_006310 [Pythium insidiosum]|uniref:Uncharacterized protein n=1 Tax=Pythium insidiosum TaxID=114742 RepID=A0AAD5M442_PYTIN|nr:hypothetical protein P43SY_006310 [Pythium insidiosum]
MRVLQRPKAEARGAAESPVSRESAALIDALGEFLLFMQRRRRRTARRPDADAARDSKRVIIEWLLHGITADEWSSLCTVVDAGFVKTVLAMTVVGANRRGKTATAISSAAPIAEFQFLPEGSTPSRRQNSAGDARKNPRLFLCRPVKRTQDGDAMAGFQSLDFISACDAVMANVRLLNSDCSCDTLTLDTASSSQSRREWLKAMDVISAQLVVNQIRFPIEAPQAKWYRLR